MTVRYGLETFSQLVVKGSLVYSEVRITDYPDYVHRGLMLDMGYSRPVTYTVRTPFVGCVCVCVRERERD